MPSLVSWIEPSFSHIRASTYPCSESESSSVTDDSAFCLIISSIFSFNSFSTLLTSFHQFDYLFVIELNSCRQRPFSGSTNLQCEMSMKLCNRTSLSVILKQLFF